MLRVNVSFHTIKEIYFSLTLKSDVKLYYNGGAPFTMIYIQTDHACIKEIFGT